MIWMRWEESDELLVYVCVHECMYVCKAECIIVYGCQLAKKDS